MLYLAIRHLRVRFEGNLGKDDRSKGVVEGKTSIFRTKIPREVR